MSTKVSVTSKQYATLDTAYRFFNKFLFDNQLPDCMIIMSRKGKNTLGWYHPKRFVKRQDKQAKAQKKSAAMRASVDELSLHPDNFLGRSDRDILATLVHEMCHVWQFHCTDKYPKNGYHDKKWGMKMDEVGLAPSNTGKPGGKRTGQQMHHYIIENGKFDVQSRKFLASKHIEWMSYPIPSAEAAKKNKVKFECPSCGAKAWGKPELNIICGECDEQMEGE